MDAQMLMAQEGHGNTTLDCFTAGDPGGSWSGFQVKLIYKQADYK